MHKYTAEEVWSLRQNDGPSTTSGNAVNTEHDNTRPMVTNTRAGEEDDHDDFTGHERTILQRVTFNEKNDNQEKSEAELMKHNLYVHPD